MPFRRPSRTNTSGGVTSNLNRGWVAEQTLKPDIVEALQFLKCLYHCDLIFREEPSTSSEPEVEVASKDHVEEDMVGGGWDALIEDLEDLEDKGYQDFDDDDVFVQSIE
ncbi:hypothetical protein EDB83DRAFT_2532167 [Lactarius deliciosus]|nr:hypothetical protein EDB83DRAFT_2532167 [Lactarius deliciosus]